MTDQPKPRRRWLQYSLRTLLILVLLFSVFCSWLAVGIQKKRAELRAMKALGERVSPSSEFVPLNRVEGSPHRSTQVGHINSLDGDSHCYLFVNGSFSRTAGAAVSKPPDRSREQLSALPAETREELRHPFTLRVYLDLFSQGDGFPASKLL